MERETNLPHDASYVRILAPSDDVETANKYGHSYETLDGGTSIGKPAQLVSIRAGMFPTSELISASTQPPP